MSQLLLSVMENNTSTNAPAPPQLPKGNEVNNDVALKYLDMYQVYATTYQQSQERDDKKKSRPVSSSSIDSVAPSMSASQTDRAVPAIVRVDSRESCLTYTPPNLPSEYTGLIVDDKESGPGYCYISLVKPEFRTEIKERLGRYPTFREILRIDRNMFLEYDRLKRLQISNIAPMHYHVVTGTIMPSVTSTLSAIAHKFSLFTVDNTALYHHALEFSTREGLYAHAPSMDDVLGSSRTPPRIHRHESSTRSPTSRYMYPPSYTYPPLYTYPDTYIHPSSNYPPYINYEYREPYSTRYNYNYITSDSAHTRIPIVEPRHDRGYHYINNRSTRSRRRSPPERHNRSYSRHDSNVYDDDLERTLQTSAAEYNSSQFGAFNLDSIRDSLDTTSQDTSPNRRTTETSRVSSAASTSSIKVYGSLQGATCNICTEIIEEGAGILPCGHLFHSECVDRWLSEHDTCPQCRARL